MEDLILLLFFVFVFFPFVLMNFQKIRKGQAEIIELLKENNRLLKKDN